MKTFNILIIQILILTSPIFAQNWPWAKQIGSNGFDAISGYCQDATGNIFICGSFAGNNCFFENDTLQQTGISRTYLAKYTSSGSEIWVKPLTTQSSSSCGGGRVLLTYDKLSNSILLNGSFCGTINFNNSIITSTNLSREGILAKLDIDGNLIWYQKIIGAGQNFVSGIGLDSNDNIYVCGINTLPAFIDTIAIAEGTFIAKYNSNGTLQWGRNICGSGDYAASIGYIAVDLEVGISNFYLVGGMGGDTINVDSVNFAQPNSFGTILTKFDFNGILQWAKVSGYPNSGSHGYSLVSDIYENIYFVSAFSDSAIFDSTTIYHSGSIGNGDIDFVKYDKSGNFKWVKQSNCSGVAIGDDVAIDTNNIIYITGKFKGNAQFGSFAISSTNGPPSQNNYDALIAAYDTAGTCLGVDHFGYAEGVNLMIDNSNNPILFGRFYNTVNIGSNAFTAMGTNGGPDAFIAKHDAITGIPDPRPITNNQLYIHANPNAGRCNITVPDEFVHEKNLVLSIYNSSGKLIQQKKLEMNEGKIKLSLEAEAKGLYNAVLSNGLKSYSGKIVFE